MEIVYMSINGLQHSAFGTCRGMQNLDMTLLVILGLRSSPEHQGPWPAHNP